MRHSAKHIIEYVGLRFFAALLRLVPYRVALLLGWLVAGLAYHVFRFRAAYFDENCRAAVVQVMQFGAHESVTDGGYISKRYNRTVWLRSNDNRLKFTTGLTLLVCAQENLARS